MIKSHRIKRFVHKKTNPNNSHADALDSLCENNFFIGKLWETIINKWIAKIDPNDDRNRPFDLIYFFDDIELYGENSYYFFDETCKKDTENLNIVMDAYQLGYISKELILKSYKENVLDFESLRNKINNYPHNPEDSDENW